MSESYSIEQHRHQFAVWTAARAVARAFVDTDRVRNAIDAAHIRETVEGGSSRWPLNERQIDELHDAWCERILDQWDRDKVYSTTSKGKAKSSPVQRDSCYGRAAKVVAIYLKTAVVLAGHEYEPFARLLHPPIDDGILKNLLKLNVRSETHRDLWKESRWTKLSKSDYLELIRSFREESLDVPAFWGMEEHWAGDYYELNT